MEANWSPEVAASLTAWLASDAPKVFSDAKLQVKALRRAGIRLGGLAFDTIVTGWLLRPSFPDKTLADLVDRYLDEKLPESDPTQLVPETEGATPGQLSWFTLRVAEALRAELADSVATVLDRHRAADAAHARRHGARGRRRLAREAVGVLGGAGRARRRDRAGGVHGDRPGGEPRLAQAAAGGPVRRARSCRRPARRRPATRRMPRCSPTCRRRTRTRSWTCCCSTAKRRSSGRSSSRSTRRSRDDGRIHTTYVQTGSQTGRLSSTDPNLQNIPVRTEESRRIRSAFEVGPGYETLLTADYSQIEMRIMAHLSEDPGLIEAFNSGEDLHRFVGARVFGVEPSDVTPAMRTKVKAMSYGLVYGLSAFGLSKQLRIEQSEAKQLMMEYFAPVRRRARLPAVVGRAGQDRRLHRDDLRPPSPVPRSREPESGAARERRARGAQRAHPGQRGRHHEDRAASTSTTTSPRAGSRVARADADPRRARGRGRAGGVGCRRAHRPRRAWATPPISPCRSTCRSAAVRTGTKPRH